MTIRTAPHFLGNGKIGFLTRDYPDPGPGELRIGVRANALCGTDRGQYERGSAVIPGHEVAGEVVAAGEQTTTPVATRGVVFLMDFCGSCRSCRAGATNQCLAKRGDLGFTRDGGYGPLVTVPETTFFPVPDDVEIGDATLLLDVMGTSSHALARARLVVPEPESVYVVGAGPIGLGLVLMSRLRLGAGVPVYVSDVSPERLALAETFGGLPVLATDAAALRGIGRPDIAFDSSGRTAARRTALDLVAKRGVLECVGHGEGLGLSVSADLIEPERAVLGSEYFRYDELPGNLELLRAHVDVLRRVISHRFGVEQIAEAFAAFLSGAPGKVLVVQDGP